MPKCEWHCCQQQAKKRFCSSKCENKFSVDRRRRRLKEMAVEYKGGKCAACGYSRYIGALQFHHLDPSQKDFSISASGATRSWAKVQTEIDKCILLCSRCHDEAHGGLLEIEGLENLSVGAKARQPTKYVRKIYENCTQCGEPSQRKVCYACNTGAPPKIQWPELDELIFRLQKGTFVGVAAELGVTDVAIRRHLSRRGVDPLTIRKLAPSHGIEP